MDSFRFILIVIGVLLFIDWTHANYHDALKWRAREARQSLTLPTQAQLAGTAKRCREGNALSCLAFQAMIERQVRVAARGGGLTEEEGL